MGEEAVDNVEELHDALVQVQVLAPFEEEHAPCRRRPRQERRLLGLGLALGHHAHALFVPRQPVAVAAAAAANTTKIGTTAHAAPETEGAAASRCNVPSSEAELTAAAATAAGELREVGADVAESEGLAVPHERHKLGLQRQNLAQTS